MDDMIRVPASLFGFLATWFLLFLSVLGLALIMAWIDRPKRRRLAPAIPEPIAAEEEPERVYVSPDAFINIRLRHAPDVHAASKGIRVSYPVHEISIKGDTEEEQDQLLRDAKHIIAELLDSTFIADFRTLEIKQTSP